MCCVSHAASLIVFEQHSSHDDSKGQQGNADHNPDRYLHGSVRFLLRRQRFREQSYRVGDRQQQKYAAQKQKLSFHHPTSPGCAPILRGQRPVARASARAFRARPTASSSPHQPCECVAMANSTRVPVFANPVPDKTGPYADKTGLTQRVLVNKIRELFPHDTVKALAAWLKVSVDTARHRIKCEREFSLEEVVELLRAEQGFEILRALMSRAQRKPRWWLACEPLMELADADLMVAEARRRIRQASQSREGVIDALEAEIRRAEAAAIHDPQFARAHADALRAMAGLVAAKR